MTTATKIIPKGYKQTEVGVIPSDWETKNLEGLVKITSGESPSRFQMGHDGTPYFKVEQLNIGAKYQKETPYYIKDRVVVPKKSLIFPKRGASILLNKIKILSEDSFMDTNLMTLTASEELDNEYLYYALLNFGLWRVADTTSIPQINNKHINPLELAFPKTKSEQTAIATALSNTDALIEKLTKLIEKKKNIKQGAMQELLTGKRRLPGFSGEWEMKKLGEVCDIDKGSQVNKSSLSVVDKYPVWNGGIEPSGYLDQWNTDENTITISEGGNSCGFVNYCRQKFWCGGHCYAVKRIKKNIDQTFLYQKLKFFQEPIMALRVGSGLPNIQKKNLLNLELNFPIKPEEQNAIATVLSDMDTEIERLESQLSKYQNLKQGMMQTLLTGKMRLI